MCVETIHNGRIAINEKRMFALQKTVNIQTKNVSIFLDFEEMCIRHWKEKAAKFTLLYNKGPSLC